MPYQGRQPGIGVRNRFVYTATGGQTTFSGADSNGKTLAYQDGAYVDVYLNGVMLVPTTDFTATTKTSITLTSGATASDVVEILAYDISSIADTVSALNGGSFGGNITVSGTITSDGADLDGAVVINESGADADFRVESDTNTHMLFVDAGNNHVNIGTSTDLGQTLNVDGGLALGSDANLTWTSNYLKFQTRSASVPVIEFLASASGGYAPRIDMYDGASTLQHRIDAGGDVTFNETGVNSDFRVESDTNTHALFVDAGEDIVSIGSPSSSANYSLFVRGNNPEPSTNTYYAQKICAANYADTGGYTTLIGFSVEAAPWSKGAIGWTRTGAYDTGNMVFLVNNAADGSQAALSDERMRINSGGVGITGSLSKSSGSFRIPHPIKPETHDLVHSFVEAPQADNIYRGKVNLAGGTATVNIDTVAGMTEGTFAALNREVQCFTSNETGWTAVRGAVNGNTLTIEAQDNTCTDTISWLVIGERQDQHMYDTEWTDENGKVIVEPLKDDN